MLMQIKIQKSPTPIIWLDTFFIIEYGKIALGEKEDKRYEALYDILLKKINQGKLLCARAEQEEELEGNVEVSMQKFLSLTKGFRFYLGSEVRTKQSNRMMRVYHNKLDTFNLMQSDACVPPKEVTGPFIVNVISIPNEAAILNKREEKELNIKEVQDFKDMQSNDIKFEEIMEREYKGIYIATTHLISKIVDLKKMYDGELDFDIKLYDQFTGLVREPLEYWHEVTGKEIDIIGYLDFLLSQDHKSIPHIDISTHMIADIMASKKPLDSGDLKDIENLSSFLPYCNFILTDKVQHNRLKRYELDKKYDVKVFCMKNIDQLIDYINAL